MYTFIYECMDSLYVNAYIYIYMYGASICIVYVCIYNRKPNCAMSFTSSLPFYVYYHPAMHVLLPSL